MSSPKKSTTDTAKSLQEEFGDEYTFQPALTKTARSLSKKKYVELQKKIEEKKKERKKKIFEEMNEECLFRPRINKDDRASASIYIDPNKSRFEVLYEQAAAKKESERRREAMNEIESDFKPKINSYNKPRSLSMQKRIAMKFKEDKAIHEKLVEKLKYDRTSRQRKREEEYRECTFQPNVSSDGPAKKVGRSKSTCLTLYKKAKIKQRQQAEEEMIRMNTKIVNTLTITKMASTAKPRVYDPVRVKTPDPTIEKAFHKEETFKPELLSSNHSKNIKGSEKRRKKILGKDKKVSVYEYLYKDGQNLQATREKVMEEAKIKSREEAKPMPIKTKKVKTKYEGDFLERQKIYEEEHAQNQKQVENKYKEEVLQEFTFKPRINTDTSQREGGSYYTGTKDDKFKRLYEQAKEKEEKLNKAREIKKDSELKGCTFKPSTNQREGGIGTADTNQRVFDRLYYYEPDSSNKQRIINDSMKECTFTPTINKKRNSNESFSPYSNHSYNATPSSARSSRKPHKIISPIYNDDDSNSESENYRSNMKAESPLKATYVNNNDNSESESGSRSISPIERSESERENSTENSSEIKRKPIQTYNSDESESEDEENNIKNSVYSENPKKMLKMPKAPSLEDEEEIIIPISNNKNGNSSSSDSNSEVSSTQSSIRSSRSNSGNESVNNSENEENYVINEDSNEITI